MRKLRVLNIITRLERGGAPMALLEILHRYDRSRFEFHLAAGRTQDPSLDLLEAGQSVPVPFHFVPHMQRDLHPVRDLIAALHLFRIIRRGRYDIVHTHTSKAGFLGRLAAAAAGVRTIVHSPHGTVLHGYFSPFVARFFATLERLCALISHSIACLTRKEIDQLLHAGVGRRSQYTHIYNGIDVERFNTHPDRREAARGRLSFSDETVVFVTVGRLVPIKGYEDLLEATRLVTEKAPQQPVRLLIVGEGELRSRLEAQRDALGIQSLVEFLGWRDDVDDILDACDVFVLSSLNEGLGLVLVEAMAKSLPVVATSVGGVPEVVDDGITGTLVTARARDDMADAMIAFARDSGLRLRMGDAGRRRAVNLFSIESTVRNTEALYAGLGKARS